MVNINSTPVQTGDSYSTKYEGQATPTATDFIFSSVQDSIIVTNYGFSYITAISGGDSVRIGPHGDNYRFKNDSDTVNIKSSYGATSPITIEGRSGQSGTGIDTVARTDIQKTGKVLNKITPKLPRIVTLVGCQDDEVPFATNCTIAPDTTNFKLNDRGWKISTTAAVTASFRLDPLGTEDPLNIGAASAIGVWVYVPNASLVSSVSVNIYGTADLSSSWTRSSSGSYTLQNGWNLLRWAATEGSLTGWGTLYRLTVSVVTTGATDITIGQLWAECPDKASMVIVADGFYQTFADLMYPEFKKRNIPVTFAVNPSKMGDTSGTKFTATEAKLKELYEDGNGNAVSMHSYARQPLSTETAVNIRADAMKCIKWLEARGYTKGKEWRAAWTQNLAQNASATKGLYLAYATPTSDASATCWPPKDRWNLNRYGLMARTTSEVTAFMDSLRTTHGFSIPYFHGLSADPQDTTQVVFDHFLAEVDSMIANNTIEFVTLDQLLTRSGMMLRQGYGDYSYSYLEVDGTISQKRLP